jgi:hypothetical protein
MSQVPIALYQQIAVALVTVRIAARKARSAGPAKIERDKAPT